MISQDIRSHERFGAPILQRISEIKTKVADCKRFHGIEFQGKYQDIPVITVRIDFPVYRLANGRTRSFQREYLALNPDAPADLFKCDHDSFAAQSAQHDILYKLVEEEDLLKAFKSEYMQQTEPTVIVDSVHGDHCIIVTKIDTNIFRQLVLQFCLSVMNVISKSWKSAFRFKIPCGLNIIGTQLR